MSIMSNKGHIYINDDTNYGIKTDEPIMHTTNTHDTKHKDLTKNKKGHSSHTENNINNNNQLKAIDDPIIESLNNQIQEVLITLGSKMENLLDNQESNFINAYKAIMRKVNNDIKELKNLLNEAYRKYNEDYGEKGIIRKQLEFFRQQSLFYSQKLMDNEKKLASIKQRADYLDFELKREHEALIQEATRKRKLENVVENIYTLTCEQDFNGVNELLMKNSHFLSPKSQEIKIFHQQGSNFQTQDTITQENSEKKTYSLTGTKNLSTIIPDQNSHKILPGIQDVKYSFFIADSEVNNMNHGPKMGIKAKNDKAVEESSFMSVQQSPEAIESKYSMKNVDISFLKDHVAKILKPYIANSDTSDILSSKIVSFLERSLNAKNQEITKLSKAIQKLSKEKSEVLKSQNLLPEFNSSFYSTNTTDEVLGIFLDYLREYQNEMSSKKYNNLNTATLVNKMSIPSYRNRVGKNLEEDLANFSNKKLSFRELSGLSKVKVIERFLNDSRVNNVLTNMNENIFKQISRTCENSVSKIHNDDIPNKEQEFNDDEDMNILNQICLKPKNQNKIGIMQSIMVNKANITSSDLNDASMIMRSVNMGYRKSSRASLSIELKYNSLTPTQRQNKVNATTNNYFISKAKKRVRPASSNIKSFLSTPLTLPSQKTNTRSTKKMPHDLDEDSQSSSHLNSMQHSNSGSEDLIRQKRILTEGPTEVSKSFIAPIRPSCNKSIVQSGRKGSRYLKFEGLSDLKSKSASKEPSLQTIQKSGVIKFNQNFSKKIVIDHGKLMITKT